MRAEVLRASQVESEFVDEVQVGEVPQLEEVGGLFSAGVGVGLASVVVVGVVLMVTIVCFLKQLPPVIALCSLRGLLAIVGLRLVGLRESDFCFRPPPPREKGGEHRHHCPAWSMIKGVQTDGGTKTMGDARTSAVLILD